MRKVDMVRFEGWVRDGDGVTIFAAELPARACQDTEFPGSYIGTNQLAVKLRRRKIITPPRARHPPSPPTPARTLCIRRA